MRSPANNKMPGKNRARWLAQDGEVLGSSDFGALPCFPRNNAAYLQVAKQACRWLMDPVLVFFKPSGMLGVHVDVCLAHRLSGQQALGADVEQSWLRVAEGRPDASRGVSSKSKFRVFPDKRGVVIVLSEVLHRQPSVLWWVWL